jgi:Leucine-rich repeat (LRR) protein
MAVTSEDAPEDVTVAAWTEACSRVAPTGEFPLRTYRVPVPEGLTDLVLANNLLETLDFDIPSSVVRLVCDHNPLKKIERLPPTIKTLECQGCGLEALPIVMEGIEVLWCYNNALTSLPYLPNAKEVFSFANSLQEVDPQSLPSCKVMWCVRNPLSEDAAKAVREARWVC